MSVICRHKPTGRFFQMNTALNGFQLVAKSSDATLYREALSARAQLRHVGQPPESWEFVKTDRMNPAVTNGAAA